MANENEAVEMTDDQDDQQQGQQAQNRRAAGGRREAISDDHDDPDALKAELEKTRKALKDANREAAERRRRLEELEAAEEEKKRAGLSEAERLKREKADAEKRAADADRKAADAEAALQRTIIDAAVEREAVKRNFIYPDIAPSLIDRKRVSIDEETGKPTGIGEALDRLLKDKPELAYASPRGGTPPREGPRRLGGGGASRQSDIEAEVRASGNYV